MSLSFFSWLLIPDVCWNSDFRFSHCRSLHFRFLNSDFMQNQCFVFELLLSETNLGLDPHPNPDSLLKASLIWDRFAQLLINETRQMLQFTKNALQFPSLFNRMDQIEQMQINFSTSLPSHLVNQCAYAGCGPAGPNPKPYRIQSMAFRAKKSTLKWK